MLIDKNNVSLAHQRKVIGIHIDGVYTNKIVRIQQYNKTEADHDAVKEPSLNLSLKGNYKLQVFFFYEIKHSFQADNVRFFFITD